MCRKSSGVALCRSQFSLSRMILSILKISDGEQPQLLEAASSFKEGTRWHAHIHTHSYLKKCNRCTCVCSNTTITLRQYECLHLILLTGFSSQEEAGDGDAAQVLWTGLQTLIIIENILHDVGHMEGNLWCNIINNS